MILSLNHLFGCNSRRAEAKSKQRRNLFRSVIKITRGPTLKPFHSCFQCDFSATCDDMHIVLCTLSAVGDVPIQINVDELQYTISTNYKSHYIHIHIISISLPVFLQTTSANCIPVKRINRFIA